MWTVALPSIEAEPTFAMCISRIRNPELKRKLESVRQNIAYAEKEYIEAAQSAQLNIIVPLDNVAGIVTNGDMESVYTNRMVKASSPGRPIYDALISAAPHGRCPFCGHRTVSTLDHLLPKSLYSSLTVTPVNLIPSCSDCNKAKSDKRPYLQGDVPLHPYFDNIENDRWLFAEVVEERPVNLRFYFQTPSAWDHLKTARAKNQFDSLQLDVLYRSQSAEELQNIRYQLNKIFDVAGKDAVHEHLKDAAISRASARLNSWQTATYEALANSEWFCREGFL